MFNPDCYICQHILKHKLYGSLLHGLHLMAGCFVPVRPLDPSQLSKKFQ